MLHGHHARMGQHHDKLCLPASHHQEATTTTTSDASPCTADVTQRPSRGSTQLDLQRCLEQRTKHQQPVRALCSGKVAKALVPEARAKLRGVETPCTTPGPHSDTADKP